MKFYFDHEKLKVYQESIRFISWIEENLSELPKGLAVRGQLAWIIHAVSITSTYLIHFQRFEKIFRLQNMFIFFHPKNLHNSLKINELSTLTTKPHELSRLDRASTSIPLNVAEGNGKFTGPDRCRFFDMARGSALECAACLDVMVAKKIVTPKSMEMGKSILFEIVNMLVGLIKANSSNRLYENSLIYGDRSEE